GARAYHMGSASSSKNPGFSLYYTFRNNSGMLVKNLPLVILMRMFPKVLRGDLDTVKTLWRTGRKKLIIHVIRGRLVGLAQMPSYLHKRHKVKRLMDRKLLWK